MPVASLFSCLSSVTRKRFVAGIIFYDLSFILSLRPAEIRPRIYSTHAPLTMPKCPAGCLKFVAIRRQRLYCVDFQSRFISVFKREAKTPDDKNGREEDQANRSR